MNNNFEVKYTVANNSIHAIEPKESNNWFRRLSPKCVIPITTDIEMEILYSYFGKIYPRSGLLKKYFVSCDGGVIDSDFRGTILILMTNNGNEPFEVKQSKRIGQFYTKKKRLRLQKLNL